MADVKTIDQAYADPAIAAKQRRVVDPQLADVHAGKAARRFSIIGEILQGLKDESGLDTVTLLDVGCASCYYHEAIEYCIPGWVKYTGADYNPGMIEMARKLYPGLPVYQADARDLSIFSDRSFDIVMEGALLIQLRDWKPALSELARVAAHWLILHRISLYWKSEPTSYKTTRAYDKTVWAVRFNKRELTEFLSKRGFGLLSIACTSDDGYSHSGHTILFGRSRP